MTQPLKLRARDAEDIQVISAMLQDAIAPVVDMRFDAENRSFVMVVQRLCREDDNAPPERICCAFNLSGVDRAKTHGFNSAETARMLDLLAVMPEGDDIQLVFAGDAALRLKLKDWTLIVEDFGDRWPAHGCPCHEDKD